MKIIAFRRKHYLKKSLLGKYSDGHKFEPYVLCASSTYHKKILNPNRLPFNILRRHKVLFNIAFLVNISTLSNGKCLTITSETECALCMCN
jgi:hypothetical protein